MKSIFRFVLIIALLSLTGQSAIAQGIYTKKDNPIKPQVEQARTPFMYRTPDNGAANQGNSAGNNDNGGTAPVGDGIVVLALLSGAYIFAQVRKKQKR